MTSGDIFFAVVFFLLIFVFIFWGSYIMRLNSKGSANKLFLMICVSMSLWSFGFGMANLARNMEAAFFWRRFSALGWTTVYSLMLHFLVLLTYKEISSKSRKLLFLLHIPASVSLFVFSFSTNFAVAQYNLVKTNFGWSNITSNNEFDWFFSVYYIVYIFTSTVIVWHWQHRLKDKKVARQAKWIVGSLFLALIIGTFTDILFNITFDIVMPQMAPLYITLPVWAMYYAAKHFGVMQKELLYKTDLIVTEEEKKNMFNNISLAFYMAAILAFVSEYIPFAHESDSWMTPLFKSLSLVVIGLLIKLIQNIKKESLKENLTIGILILSIPMVILQYLDFGSTTIWSVPLIIIISSIVFGKKSLLILTVLVSVFTQMLIWIIQPHVIVSVDKYDYMLRMGVYIVAFLMSLYVNKIYVSKITENKEQIELQKISLELTSDFVNINQSNYDEKINITLSKIGTFLQADRAYLFIMNHESQTMTNTHEWCEKAIDSVLDSNNNLPFSKFPWLINEFQKNSIINVKNIDDSHEMSKQEKEFLKEQNIKSLVTVSIESNNVLKGFIGLDAVGSLISWSDDKLKLLNLLSNLLASGINKIQSEKEINFMAYYDNLTKLPNRFLFADQVNYFIELAKRTGKSLSVIFIDLDNFKIVNDTLGHSSGDDLLKDISNGLKHLVRKSDMVSRFGGDEFLIMLSDINDPQDIIVIVEKIMAYFSDFFNVNGQDFLITASAGISIYPIDGHEAEILIKNADAAMYMAKENGKNQYVLSTATMKEEIHTNMILSNDLYRALERNEFLLYYQPQVDLKTGNINGLEALIRWNHPQRGLISPGIFIPLAEKNGLINSIGDWVLRTACLQSKRLESLGLGFLKMAVNLSITQFINPHITKNVEGILIETGLSPECLELEITEGVAIKEANETDAILKKFKDIGISIAIDDFGTEYSSLNRLKVLPIDRIKIDMLFTQGIENNKKDRAIILVIINLAKNLGMNVIAEGAETKEQIEFLKNNLCDDVQGYYYYKPMPASELEKVLLDLKMGIRKG